MALLLVTAEPRQLLAKIKAAIDAGRVKTWAYDSDGDFTHTPAQWERKAWLRPRFSTDGLRLATIPPKNAAITWETYGVYMGRFAEMAIAHFHGSFTTATSSASPATDDQVGS